MYVQQGTDAEQHAVIRDVLTTQGWDLHQLAVYLWVKYHSLGNTQPFNNPARLTLYTFMYNYTLLFSILF